MVIWNGLIILIKYFRMNSSGVCMYLIDLNIFKRLHILQRRCHEIKKYVMMSNLFNEVKVRHDVKRISLCQKYVMT